MLSAMKKKFYFIFQQANCYFPNNPSQNIHGNSERRIKLNMRRARFESLQLQADEKHATSNITQFTLASLQKTFSMEF